tara:strand:- start:34362 stop:36050 length:1689 start_codon:yes stop_codon:yes gene_type:complete
MSAARSSAKKKKSGRIIWFGIPFLLAGLGVIIFGPLATFYEHFNSSEWERVPVHLSDIRVESHQGDDSTTYSIEANYSYQYRGQRYAASRVGYDVGNDNIGNDHHSIVGDIRRQQARGTLRAWVNPDAPHESYLLRQLRWKKILFMGLFGLIFSVAGGGIMLAGKLRTGEKVNGKEVIYSSERHGFWLFAFMAFMFIGISLPPVLAIVDEIRKGNWLILVVLLFPLAGIWLAYMAWKSRRDWKFYGPLPLTLTPFPGQLGGDVAGQIELPNWYGECAWRVTLQCVRIVTSSGKNSSTRESILWQKDQAPHVVAQGVGSAVRFVFTPPPDLSVTGKSGRERIEWRVSLLGPKTPVPLERTYSIPVELGDGKARALPTEHVARSEKQALFESISAAADQIDVQQLGDGLRLYSRVGRNASMALVLLVMGVVFSGASIGMGMVAAEEGFMLYVMSFFFGLFGFPMFFGGVFMAGRALEARVSAQQVDIVRYWGGRALWRRHGSLQRADQLILTSGGSSTSGNRKTEYFHIEVSCEGKKLRIAEGLVGREVAEAMRDNVIRLLRLP